MQWTTLGPDICSQVKKLPAKWNVLCQPKDQGALENMIYVHVKNNALPVINKDYTFSELINPVFREFGNQIQVWVFVKYLDETTKTIQFSQYELSLEKDINWMIIK